MFVLSFNSELERGALTLFKKETFSRRILSNSFQQKRPSNGFLLAESLLALLICMISGCLLMGAISTLSRSAQLSVQTSIEMSEET